MKRDARVFLIAAVTMAAGLVSAGCGQMREEGVTPVVEIKESEKASEAPVVVVTEAVTEAARPETEFKPQPVTELQEETQPATELQAETQPAVNKELSAKQEKAQEQLYENWVTMWATDDVNVREKPTTKKDNIFNSFAQGDAVTVIGETPNWYVVHFDEDDSTGYVSKQFISSTEVAPMTDEEREAAQQAAAAAPAASGEMADADDNMAPAPAEAPAAPAAASSGGSGSVTVSSDANVRASAGERGEVIGVLNAGTAVTVTGEEGGWYQIDYNGSQGYINKNLVG